jgi:phosphopantothenoylcysteine decarboxylase
MSVESKNATQRKPRVLLCVSGSVAAIKTAELSRELLEFAEVRVIVTKWAMHFINISEYPKGVELLTDEQEWSSFTQRSDPVVHIEVRLSLLRLSRQINFRIAKKMG